MFSLWRPRWLVILGLLATWFSSAFADDPRSVSPTVGLRQNAPTSVLLQGATVMTGPEDYFDPSPDDSDSPARQKNQKRDVLIRGGSIVAVAATIAPPAGCRILDCAGQTLSAGWINTWQEVGADQTTPPEAGDDYWNANIVVNRRVHELSNVPNAEKLRGQGFTTTVLAPRGRILGGHPSAWSLNESKDGHPGPQRIADTNWMTAALSVPRPNDAAETQFQRNARRVAARHVVVDVCIRWFERADGTAGRENCQ